MLPADLSFAQPWWFLLLPVAALLALLLRGRKSGAPSVPFSSSVQLLKGLTKPRRWGFGGLSSWLLALSLVCAVIALARPQKVRTTESIKASGIEIVVAIDVSLSMAIEDFTIQGRRVNRLTAAKKVTSDFVEGRPTDRIGLVAFAGRPYVPSPLTLDHEWLKESIIRLRLGMVEDGTAIGSAIAASARRLDGRDAKSKIIVLLTDGANNSGDLDPMDAAQLARTLGVRIYTVAVGTPGMHPIPSPDGSGRAIGSIRQEFDLEALQEIAKIGEGAFFRAQGTDALTEIFAKIDELEKTELEHYKIVESEDFFHLPIAASLAFAFLFLFFSETTARRTP